MIARIEQIVSLDLPALEPYRTLKMPLEHLQKGIFVAEGEKVVSRLLSSTLRTYSVLLSKEWFEIFNKQLHAHRDLIDIYVGEKRLIDTIVGYRLHQAIMAVGQAPKPKSISELCAFVQERKHFVGVIADGITNAENMGVIIRNCACFGVDAVIPLPNSCNPYLRRAVRNSMGNIFHVPIFSCSDTLNELQNLKTAGVQFYGAHPHSSSKNLRQVEFAPKSCIVFGAEGNGISETMLRFCNELITIPMKEGIDSLNVASASAVVLYEWNIHYSNSMEDMPPPVPQEFSHCK